MTRVLVTGAGGFVGRATVPFLLERGFEVHGVTSGRSALPVIDGIEWHKADLLDAAEVEVLVQAVDAERLLHLAWYAVPGLFWSSPANVRWVEASLGLVRRFAELGGQRAVVAGSCDEYDLFQGVCSEDSTPPRPGHLYGVCKHAVQSVLAAASPGLGLSVASGRIFFVYGPGEDPRRLVASTIRSILAGETATCRFGGHVRDYLHVDDVGSALAALVAAEVEGPVNVASGRPLLLRDLMGLIGDQLGRPDLVSVGHSDVSPDEPPAIVADVRRLHDEVGWAPRFSLQSGVAHAIRWQTERRAGPVGADLPFSKS